MEKSKNILTFLLGCFLILGGVNSILLEAQVATPGWPVIAPSSGISSNTVMRMIANSTNAQDIAITGTNAIELKAGTNRVVVSTNSTGSLFEIWNGPTRRTYWDGVGNLYNSSAGRFAIVVSTDGKYYGDSSSYGEIGFLSSQSIYLKSGQTDTNGVLYVSTNGVKVSRTVNNDIKPILKLQNGNDTDGNNFGFQYDGTNNLSYVDQTGTRAVAPKDLLLQNRSNGVVLSQIDLAANGNVGIGTVSPYHKMTVESTPPATDATIAVASFVRKQQTNGYGSTVKIQSLDSSTYARSTVDFLNANGTVICTFGCSGSTYNNAPYPSLTSDGGYFYSTGSLGFVADNESKKIMFQIGNGSESRIKASIDKAGMSVNGSAIISTNLTVTNQITSLSTNFTLIGSTGGYDRTCRTPDGGFAIRLTNNTGASSIKGTVVSACTNSPECVMLTPASWANPIGIIAESGVGTNQPVWVVTSGRALVLLKDGTSATNGNWVYMSDTAGRAAANIGLYPDLTGLGGVQQHALEIGHSLGSFTNASTTLIPVNLHFQ